MLRHAGVLWTEHAAEIADWLVGESGSVRTKAQLEVATAARECFEAAGLPTCPAGDVLASAPGRWSLARRRPSGVVSVIAPFNFPLILSIRSVAPALALGNAVLLKPDPRTSVSGGVVLALPARETASNPRQERSPSRSRRCRRLRTVPRAFCRPLLFARHRRRHRCQSSCAA